MSDVSQEHEARGGAPVAVLNRLDAWEANLVLNLRLWCEGPRGRGYVWSDYSQSFPNGVAESELQSFEELLRLLVSLSMRPLVRHCVGCACVGSDEGVFLHLVRTASDGHLNDAALIASMMVGPARAEQIAMLAGQVGDAARRMRSGAAGPSDEKTEPATFGANVIRLH